MSWGLFVVYPVKCRGLLFRRLLDLFLRLLFGCRLCILDVGSLEFPAHTDAGLVLKHERDDLAHAEQGRWDDEVFVAHFQAQIVVAYVNDAGGVADDLLGLGRLGRLGGVASLGQLCRLDFVGGSLLSWFCSFWFWV